VDIQEIEGDFVIVMVPTACNIPCGEWKDLLFFKNFVHGFLFSYMLIFLGSKSYR
jgi:hypothetical protein